jgi:hypothetical protein
LVINHLHLKGKEEHMSEQAQAAPALEPSPSIESPPAAPMPPREQLPDPRLRLLQLASELTRASNPRLLVEYLRLRRAIA